MSILSFKGYMKIMKKNDSPIPPELMGDKGKAVFGNIESIFEWHREYVIFLIKCNILSCFAVFVLISSFSIFLLVAFFLNCKVSWRILGA